MKKSIFTLLIVLVLSAIVLSACGGSSDGGSSSISRPETPQEYASLSNPLSGADAVTAGKTLYDANCASCHGDAGLGDGVAGTQLEPKPANLVTSAKETTQGYLYYRILKGGMMNPINSSMPAHEGLLTEEEIWQVVSYIESWK